MHSFVLSSIRLIVLLSLVLVVSDFTAFAQDAPFHLSFDASDTVSGQPGELVRFPVRVRLTTNTGQPEGPSAWSLGVSLPDKQVVNCRIVEATTAGTVAAETHFGGRREDGFEQTEAAANGNGVVSTVALSSPSRAQALVTLPDGTWTILALVVEVRVPVPDAQGVATCGKCVLSFSSTLMGSGQTVPLVVTFQNKNHTPETSEKTIEICPSPCFKSEPVPDWRQVPIGGPFAPASRQVRDVYELCSTSTGYSATSDSIQSLSRMTSRRFDFSTVLLSLAGPGAAGLEVRAFESGQVPTQVYFGVRWAMGRLIASVRDSRGGEEKVLQVIPMVPMGGHRLRIQGDGNTLASSFSTDGGKTFEILAKIPVKGELAAPFLRAAMVQSSDGKSPSIARFRDPRIVNPIPPGRPRIPVASLAPLSGNPEEVTSLTIPGRDFSGVTEVLVAGSPARIVKIGEKSIEVEVSPTDDGRPVRGDIILRGSFGESVIPNTFFSYPKKKFIRCDCNGDGEHDVSDALAGLGTLFLGTEPCDCELAGDCNVDGVDDISDAVYGLTYLFVGGIEPPQAPYPDPGGDCGIEVGPEITAISQTTINEGDIFTITGSGFLPKPSANAVVAGGSQMTVLTASPTALTVRADKIVRGESTQVIVVTDFFHDIIKELQLARCGPGVCPPLLIGPFVIFEELVTLVSSDDRRTKFLGSSELTKDGVIEILFDRDQFDPTQDIEVVANLLIEPHDGVSPGARSTRFVHTFSSSDISFERGLHELGRRIGEELGGGRPLHGFGIRTVPESASIRLEPTRELREFLDDGPSTLEGRVSLYGPPIGLCGPEDFHPILDERPFCWCRFEELVETCAGLPDFEWFIPKEFVLAESESLASLPHPNERLPHDKEIMYNRAAYCHVRQHKLWNKCEQEKLVEAAGGDTDIPPFPRDAWVLKTNWVAENEMPQAMLDLVPEGASPTDVFYSYVYDGPGEKNGTRYYLVLLHHTTKDINDWVWYDIYLPGDPDSQEPDMNGGKQIGGCGGRNDDIPAGLDGSIWNNYFLCTDVEHEQPLEEESVPSFRAGWCGNAWIDSECPDSFDGQGGGDTCMNCHDASTPGLVHEGAKAVYSAGTLDLDFLFSISQTIAVPDPCDDDPITADFDTDVEPIFLTSCGCHLSEFGSAGLNLSEGNGYDNLVGQASTQVPAMDRVTPGDLDNSYLWHKLKGTQEGCCVDGNNRMPDGGPPWIVSTPLSIIELWINEGANP